MGLVETCFIIFICINIIVGLMVLNWLLTFVLLYTKHVPQILPRYPKAIILCCIIFTIHLLITSPLGLVINGLLVSMKHEQRYPALDFTYSALWNLSIGAMSWSFIHRVWMIYYDIKWNLALEDAEWQLHIDTHLQKESNWFLRKKQSWGNSKISAFIFFTIWSAFSIILIILVAIQGLEGSHKARTPLILLQGFLFPLVFFGVIACKLPSFNDVYSLRQEIKYVLVIYIIFIMSTLACLPIAVFGKVGYGVMHLQYCLWVTLLSYMILQWSLRKYNLPANVCSAIHYNMEELAEYLKKEKDTEAAEDHLTYLDLLKDDAGFRAYINHLSRSYAVENLLFILEIYQFKKKVKSLFADDDELDGSMSVTDGMEITVNAPKSTLVAQMDSDDDVKERVCVCMSLLFLKYIQNGAYFCINLSYEVREELYANFGYSQDQKTDIIEHIKNNKTEQQLYTMFDGAINEVSLLLHGRVAAFKRSDEFKMYKQNQ